MKDFYERFSEPVVSLTPQAWENGIDYIDLVLRLKLGAYTEEKGMGRQLQATDIYGHSIKPLDMFKTARVAIYRREIRSGSNSSAVTEKISFSEAIYTSSGLTVFDPWTMTMRGISDAGVNGTAVIAEGTKIASLSLWGGGSTPHMATVMKYGQVRLSAYDPH